MSVFFNSEEMKVGRNFVMDDMRFLNDNLSSNTNPRFLEECEGEIIMLFRVKFGKEVSLVVMLSIVVLDELISSYWRGAIILCI